MAPKEKRCRHSRQQETNGEPRLAFERRLTVREVRREKGASSHRTAREKRLGHSFFPPCKILSKEDWKESRWGERIYAVRDQGIKYNLKTTEGVYKILGYCN